MAGNWFAMVGLVSPCSFHRFSVSWCSSRSNTAPVSGASENVEISRFNSGWNRTGLIGSRSWSCASNGRFWSLCGVGLPLFSFSFSSSTLEGVSVLWAKAGLSPRLPTPDGRTGSTSSTTAAVEEDLCKSCFRVTGGGEMGRGLGLGGGTIEALEPLLGVATPASWFPFSTGLTMRRGEGDGGGLVEGKKPYVASTSMPSSLALLIEFDLFSSPPVMVLLGRPPVELLGSRAPPAPIVLVSRTTVLLNR
mmetsp:Transcript_20830/g.57900  ORF Transcript_20830/g.57900 Transcript_20830/m.57900 type:complete len:249 (+) Transcript_20830:188-934(+)